MKSRAWYKFAALIVMAAMLASMMPSMKANELEAYTFEEVFDELLVTHGELISYEGMYDTLFKSGNVSVVDVDYQGSLQKGLYAEVDSFGDNLWSTQAIMDLLGEIQEGDVIFIAYKIKGIESLDEAGEVTVSDKVRPSPSRPGRSVGVDATVIANGEWNQIYGGVEATWDTGEGEVPQFVIHMAYELQKLEITDIQVINFRQNIDVTQLPQMDREFTYEGRESDAAWRADADQRIEEFRKADVTVKVVDQNGQPLPGVEVAINQEKHDYSFGSIMNFNVIDSNRSQQIKDQYLELIKMTSNSSGESNNLKWHRIYEMEDNIDRNLTWAEANNIKMRGHVLIWGQWSKPPAHLVAEMQSDPEILRQRTIEHITEAITKYKGRLSDWDVVNEPLSSRDFTNVLGNEVMLDWFAAAHQADPDIRLFLNDYGLLTNDIGHGNYTYDLLEYLVENEAPIHGIGMQGHFSGKNPIAPVTMLGILDRFGGLGLDIEVTEFTFDTKDEQLQADFWRDVLTVVFSHPSTTGFHTWGLWEGQIDKSDSAMFRHDFSPKPNGEVWMDLIYNEWWTNESGTTDQNGEFTTRAFLGEHEITVSNNAQELTYNISLDAAGKELIVQLDTSLRMVISTPEVTVSPTNKALEITEASKELGVPLTVNVPASVTDATIAVPQLIHAPTPGDETVTTAELPAVNVAVTAAVGSSEGTIALSIPEGTIITAPVDWQGTINLPTIREAGSVTVTPDTGKLATVNTVIEVGSDDVPLTFNKAVRLVIPGMAGKDAGYYRDSTFTKITSVLSEDSQSAADAELPEGGDARIVVGNDLVIWTKHFTRFIAYTQSQASSGWHPGSGSGSGPVAPATEPDSESDSESGAEPVTTPAIKSDFSDTAGHWALEAIETLVGLGAVEGFPDNSFRPDRSITRAEFVKMLIAAFKLEVKPGKLFKDTEKHWAKDYIATAYEEGIVGGYSDTRFAPDDLITREQMAVMIMRAAKLPAADADLSFTDASELSSWAREAVHAVNNSSIIAGYPDGSFKPRQHATRAEAVTMIVKSLQND